LADKVVNPVTDAIRSVIGEYKSLVEDAPKKKSPKITGEKTRRKSRPVRTEAFMAEHRLTGPKFRRPLDA
jgi:hypothetical protein